MTQPVVTPPPAPRRPHSRPRLAAGIALALTLVVVGFGAFQLGSRYSPVDAWDPLWLRVYMDRPLDTAAPGTGFWVAGYMVDYDKASFEVVKTRANHMDQVVVFGYGFDREGNLQGTDHTLIRGLTAKAKRVILFGNLTNGGFDKDTAHAILTDPAVQDRAIQAMLEKAQNLDVGGIQIDFENLAPSDRDAYTAFLKRLKGELKPLGLTLSVAVAAKTSDTTTGWGGATDYPAIGQVVDQVYIMAYDEHWAGGEPGPVASLPWVEKVVRYATGVIPAQKIILGVPFYGYEWTLDPSGGPGKGKAFGSARMATRTADGGATVKWDPVAGENVATYKTAEGDRVAWWPDERSMEAKLKLAYQYNLKGVAPWRLGFEPDDWWNGIGAFRVKPTK